MLLSENLGSLRTVRQKLLIDMTINMKARL